MNKNVKLLILDLMRLKEIYSNEEFTQALGAFSNSDEYIIREIIKKLSAPKQQIARKTKSIPQEDPMPPSVDWLKEENPLYYRIIKNFYSKIQKTALSSNPNELQHILDKLCIKPEDYDAKNIQIKIVEALARAPESVGVEVIQGSSKKQKVPRNQYVELANVIMSGSRKNSQK